MAEPVLTQRALNRALLERQLLLERSQLSIEEAVERVGGLQTQYAPSGYVGLWTRLAGFRREELTRALEERRVVQGTLMRATIHMVSAREYWRYAAGVREARQAWLRRLSRPGEEEAMLAGADELTRALADGPREAKALGELGSGFLGRLSIWVDIVRVPPSGTWERRRADRLALASEWIGPNDSPDDEGLAHLVRAHLRAFGPAPWRDIASWAGISATDAKRGGALLDLHHYRDEAGHELIDLADLPLPDADLSAPVRFLPHWDALLLAHARRCGVLPEVHRPRVFSSHNPFSVGTYLVDGRVVGAWSLRDGKVVLDPFEEVSAADAREIEREREALEAFHA
jgi:hypothetical protein